MAIDGTAAYQAYAARFEVPPLVRAAVELARESGFAYSCLPEHGELLRVLARGAGPGVIGETGTGTGAGPVWLVCAEADGDCATKVTGFFRDIRQVEILHGERWELRVYEPFDLLTLEHPQLRAAQVNVTPERSELLATCVP